MKNLLAALTAIVSLVLATSAVAGPMRYGVADDWPEFHPCGDVWWTSAADIGYQDLRMTVRWDESMPTTIPYQGNLQASVDCAVLAGIRPILAIFPLHAAAIGSDPTAQAEFATFVALVGQAFPHVTDFVVGNEPNVNRFWQPQYVAGKDAAATDYEHTLAASYDALKAVRPDATVWGPAISSRGNDNPYAVSNPSHSPVWFIKYLGDAYRASGRAKPIFDEFDMHPYPPVQDIAPFSRPFRWPQAGAADLDRIKQALWDAFAGTAQPVPAEQPAGRSTQRARLGVALPIDLDEAGEQTVVTGHEAAYVRPPENVQPVGQAVQAARHVELAHIGECDPDVETVLWFPLIDDAGLSDGFQSGNLFADLAHKQSYGAMQAAIAADRGACVEPVAGVPTRWAHARGVAGAHVVFAAGGAARLQTSLTTAEDALYTATLFAANAGRRKKASIRAAAPLTGAAPAYTSPVIRFKGPLRPGAYTIQIVLRAATNPARTTTFVSRRFAIGASCGGARKRAAGPKTTCAAG